MKTNALQAKINRYKLFLIRDYSLLETHPNNEEYRKRLKNHQNKLNRLLEKQEKALNPPPHMEPPLHPGITFSDYNKLINELDLYIAELDRLEIPRPAEDPLAVCLCNADGGPVEWAEASFLSFSIIDFDGLHDFDILTDRLKTVGIEVPVHPKEIWSGDTVTEWGARPYYGFNIPLKK